MLWTTSKGFMKLISLVCMMLAIPLLACNATAQSSFTQAQRYERQLEVGGIDEFRFDVSPSKVVHLRIGAKEPSEVLPTVWLYGPSFKLIANPRRNSTISLDCSNSSRECQITETGTHRLVITDYSGPGSGNYYIELLQLDGMNPAARFVKVQSYVATSKKGSVNMHAFSATPTSTMHFKITSIGDHIIEPKVWLYSPTGRLLLESRQDRSTNFICGQNNHCRLPETGRYSVVVTHYGDKDGQYRLSVVSIPTASQAPQTLSESNENIQPSYGPQDPSNDKSEIMRQETMHAYQAHYPDGVFFRPQDEASDGLPHLGGQCIAWAKRLYDAAATKPISSYSFGVASNIPNVLKEKGYTVVTNPKAPKVGALIVWEDPDRYGPGKGGAGHVGVVTGIKQGPLKDGGSYQILISEANFPDSGSRITEDQAAVWGLSAESARKEFVTTSYGMFQERVFDTNSLNRGAYKFKAYVYP